MHILLIAVPLTIQTFFIFEIAYMGAKLLKLPHNIAVSTGMIGASNSLNYLLNINIYKEARNIITYPITLKKSGRTPNKHKLINAEKIIFV